MREIKHSHYDLRLQLKLKKIISQSGEYRERAFGRLRLWSRHRKWIPDTCGIPRTETPSALPDRSFSIARVLHRRRLFLILYPYEHQKMGFIISDR